VVIAKKSELKTTKVKRSTIERTRFERYFTPRPTPETAERIESPMMVTRPVIRPTVLGAGVSPVRSISQVWPVVA